MDSYTESFRSLFVSFFFLKIRPAPTLDGKDAASVKYVAEE